MQTPQPQREEDEAAAAAAATAAEHINIPAYLPSRIAYYPQPSSHQQPPPPPPAVAQVCFQQQALARLLARSLSRTQIHLHVLVAS